MRLRRAKKLAAKLEQDLAELQPFADVTSKQRVKCLKALAAKYEAALKPYLPGRWVSCIALQQARLQEHALIQAVGKEKGKQQDIRSLFVKAKEKKSEVGVLKKYKAKYTEIFKDVSECAKEGRLPPFLPVTQIKEESKERVKSLLLMSKCRLSLVPFFDPDVIASIVRHEIKLITSRTPDDDTKKEYIETIKSKIERAISNKQPFLLSDSEECSCLFQKGPCYTSSRSSSLLKVSNPVNTYEPLPSSSSSLREEAFKISSII